MSKTILVTGSSDGLGLEAAKRLAASGHRLILHGRSEDKLKMAVEQVQAQNSDVNVDYFTCDFSIMAEVRASVTRLLNQGVELDVLLNNAGIFHTPNTRTVDGFDIRFAVNTFAPYILTTELMPLLTTSARVVNLSSAAQAPVNLDALTGQVDLDAMAAYSQSKLALTMWSLQLAKDVANDGPLIVALNPGSMLATKMVKDGFGVDGADIGIGADIMVAAAVGDQFADSAGKYFDNDSGAFAAPHPDALDSEKNTQLVASIQKVLEGIG